MKARISAGQCEIDFDLSNPISLGIDLDFSERQPRHFGAPAATSQPYAVPGFSGSVEHGASCNCRVLTLNPHCNGTHTECVGHLTRERADAYKVVPFGWIPTVLLSIEPAAAEVSGESTEPVPHPGDLLITRRALEASWSKTPTPGPKDEEERRQRLVRALQAQHNAAAIAQSRPAASFEQTMSRGTAVALNIRGLVIRTLPNSPEKLHQDYSNQTPPYLSREAAEWLVARGIEHLVVDLPSIDRSHDEGRLTAHRVFFGLPSASVTLSQAKRASATITELAYIPDTAADGQYLMQLQVPALGGDAVPSRPLLYPLLPS